MLVVGIMAIFVFSLGLKIEVFSFFGLGPRYES